MSAKAQIIVRDGLFTDYPKIKDYDEFLGDRRLDLQAGRLVVADIGPHVAAGYACIDPDRFMAWPLLSRLCVSTEMRDQGIAITLLEHVVNLTRFARLYTSTEASNTVMLHIFKKVGGQAIGHADKLNFNEEREMLFRLK